MGIWSSLPVRKLWSQTHSVEQQSLWPTGAGLLIVKELPVASTYLSGTFDLAQTNQPEGMDFPLVYMFTDTQKEKATIKQISANS